MQTLKTDTLRKILTTDKQLFAAVRALGITIGKRDGEYRVNFKGGTESTACYTNDRADAYGTAQAMRHCARDMRAERTLAVAVH